MSWGGHVSAMLSSLKNNSRKKDETHFNRRGMPLKGSNKINPELLKRKATPDQLATIRKKVITEKKTTLIKTIVFLVVIALLLFIIVKLLF